ncbi:MAG: hypothetical protein L6R41_006268 [Letrouitia leprolyta]|nr:MAG: hypothetical protein L6R41_006268 [Letrouitia leprolyta]
MDSGDAASLVALVVALFALLVALAQVTQQYFATAQNMRKCDNYVAPLAARVGLMLHDADRLPSDLHVVPMQVSLRDVIAFGLLMGMSVTESERAPLEMTGPSSSITNNRSDLQMTGGPQLPASKTFMKEQRTRADKPEPHVEKTFQVQEAQAVSHVNPAISSSQQSREPPVDPQTRETIEGKQRSQKLKPEKAVPRAVENEDKSVSDDLDIYPDSKFGDPEAGHSICLWEAGRRPSSQLSHRSSSPPPFLTASTSASTSTPNELWWFSRWG